MYFKTMFSFLEHKELVWEMTKRDLTSLTKGALLGYLWLVVNPLVQVAAYVVIVSFVFAKSGDRPMDYALYVLSGMIPWQIVTKSLQDAPSIVRDRVELVKQVVYPVETLPLTGLLFGSFGSFISFCVFFLISIIVGELGWSVVLLPLPFVLLVLFVLGISWVFSIAGVLLKDLREIVTVFLSVIVFFSPVVLSEAIVGAEIWRIIMYNPLAHIIVCFRDIFYATFHPVSWVVFVVMSATCFFVGGWVITRAKMHINEYI